MTPAISRSNVLLPQPLRPTMPTDSPFATLNETLRNGQYSVPVALRPSMNRFFSSSRRRRLRANLIPTLETTMAFLLNASQLLEDGRLDPAEHREADAPG